MYRLLPLPPCKESHQCLTHHHHFPKLFNDGLPPYFIAFVCSHPNDLLMHVCSFCVCTVSVSPVYNMWTWCDLWYCDTDTWNMPSVLDLILNMIFVGILFKQLLTTQHLLLMLFIPFTLGTCIRANMPSQCRYERLERITQSVIWCFHSIFRH